MNPGSPLGGGALGEAEQDELDHGQREPAEDSSLIFFCHSRGRRKTKGARDRKRLSFGRRNPAYAKLIVEIDQADQVGNAAPRRVGGPTHFAPERLAGRCHLVPRFYGMEGYRRRSLIRASAAEKRHFTFPVVRALRQAASIA